jgi:hypothetical protein
MSLLWLENDRRKEDYKEAAAPCKHDLVRRHCPRKWPAAEENARQCVGKSCGRGGHGNWEMEVKERDCHRILEKNTEGSIMRTQTPFPNPRHPPPPVLAFLVPLFWLLSFSSFSSSSYHYFAILFEK